MRTTVTVLSYVNNNDQISACGSDSIQFRQTKSIFIMYLDFHAILNSSILSTNTFFRSILHLYIFYRSISPPSYRILITPYQSRLYISRVSEYAIAQEWIEVKDTSFPFHNRTENYIENRKIKY
uniref:Uncharacterized protein n=1 Tax=Heterorhabditis bacteriophora TaxID=37862 RepID=A0A1I7X152_HETBA